MSCFLLVAGCSAGKEYDLARKAELSGDAPKAYDTYLKAAEKHPGDGGVIGGLKRTAPAAADFWESEAILAANEGRYDDAWRMWMRVLEIQPGHQTAPGVIRQLEEQHGSVVALASADYLRGGSKTLARVPPSGTTPTAPPREPITVASAKRSADLSQPDQNQPEALARVDSERKPPDERNLPTAGTSEPARALGSKAPVDAADRAAETKPRQTGGEKPRVAGATTVAGPDAASGEDGEPKPVKLASPPKAIKSPAQPAKVKTEKPTQTPRTSLPPTPPIVSPAPSGTPDTTVCRILSKKDRRYPQATGLVDGISIKLRDTDDDLDADFDLLDGKQRIKKVRGLSVGRSCAFRGQSGAYYQVIVLEVLHQTRTVRLGVRPV